MVALGRRQVLRCSTSRVWPTADPCPPLSRGPTARSTGQRYFTFWCVCEAAWLRRGWLGAGGRLGYGQRASMFPTPCAAQLHETLVAVKVLLDYEEARQAAEHNALHTITDPIAASLQQVRCLAPALIPAGGPVLHSARSRQQTLGRMVCNPCPSLSCRSAA